MRVPQSSSSDARAAEPAAQAATAARTSARIWSALARTAAAFALLSALVVALVMKVAEPPALANVVAFAGVLAPLAFAAFAEKRGRDLAATVPALVDRAWHAAIVDLGRDGRSLDPTSLAAATRLTSAEAERYLAALARAGRVLVTGTSGGAPRYAVPSAGPLATPGAD